MPDRHTDSHMDRWAETDERDRDRDAKRTRLRQPDKELATPSTGAATQPMFVEYGQGVLVGDSALAVQVLL